MATTDEEKMIAQIKDEILKDNMEFHGESRNEGVAGFEKSDRKYEDLQYGFVSIVGDGEVQ